MSGNSDDRLLSQGGWAEQDNGVSRAGASLSGSQPCTSEQDEQGKPQRWKPGRTVSRSEAESGPGAKPNESGPGGNRKPICRPGSGLVRIIRIRYSPVIVVWWEEAALGTVHRNEGENFWFARTALSPTKGETFGRLQEWDNGEDHLLCYERDGDENVWVECGMESNVASASACSC